MARVHPLVRTIEALGTIEPSSPFERTLAWLLMATYKRRLRTIVATVPAWVSEHIGGQRAALWMSENRATVAQGAPHIRGKEARFAAPSGHAGA
jgi:hypothetical protein